MDEALAADAANSEARNLRQVLRLRLGLDQAEVVVLEVGPGSEARRIGLLKGDILVRYAGQPIPSLDQLAKLIGTTKGTEIELEIRRDGQPRKFSVKPGRLGATLSERIISDKKGQ